MRCPTSMFEKHSGKRLVNFRFDSWISVQNIHDWFSLISAAWIFKIAIFTQMTTNVCFFCWSVCSWCKARWPTCTPGWAPVDSTCTMLPALAIKDTSVQRWDTFFFLHFWRVIFSPVLTHICLPRTALEWSCTVQRTPLRLLWMAFSVWVGARDWVV